MFFLTNRCVAGTARSAVLPWSEVKSLLQGKTNISEKSEEQTRDQPGKNTDVSFRVRLQLMFPVPVYLFDLSAAFPIFSWM